MTSEVDIVNQSLSLLGTRSTIVSLNEGSNESVAALTWLNQTRDELLRLAPWNFCRNYQALSLICAAPGTPENPTQGTTQWQRGIPMPPWFYEYAYPSNCSRLLFLVPQFVTGFAGGVPITTAVTGGAATYWNGPPVKFQIALDQIDQGTGKPSNTGVDTKIILTNQEFAIAVYNKQITDPNLMDDQFTFAWASLLAARMVMQLTGDKQLANTRIKDTNDSIIMARVNDGNEGMTINDVMPDWIKARGVEYENTFGVNAMGIDWGGVLALY
ncbi:MAG TPA: hypothetical protein VFV92_01005 [Candidatus Bathyarchaeia archaeon]|nr:hypothetical protein [Candidatus Bathyarchaeia archaeon]